MTLAFVFPGQGSQSVGMLAALGAAEPVVRETFEEASQVLGYDLWALAQQGPEADLGTTERTQPAMLASGVTTLVECGPGKVLTSLNKRVEKRPDLKVLAVDDPDTLAAALSATGG